MTIVVDTSVLVDILRRVEAARAALREATGRGETLVASVLTKVELLQGMRPGEKAGTRAVMDRLEWITVDDELAERAGELARRYARSHSGIGPVDIVIAATAQRMNAQLWTRNVRHFPMFSDLEPPY
jgi:predicted nucleic acid-binding protein